MQTKLTFRDRAEAQGVSRPFDILVRMSPQSRCLVAEVLSCNIDGLEEAEEQAWRIINQNLRGLQARTHTLPEQLTPFSPNNTWWDIVTRTARRIGVKFYPGMKDEEVEQLLFERLAAEFFRRNLPDEAEAIDQLAQSHPDFEQAIRGLRLSPEATRAILTSLVLATVRADQNLRDGVTNVSLWLRSHLRWVSYASMSAGLRLVHERLAGIYHTWVMRGFSGRARTNRARVCTALAVIYFQDLVERTLDEYETVRS
jgi:hypothetical protein